MEPRDEELLFCKLKEVINMGSARTEINGKRIGRGFASLSDKQKQFFEMLENKKGVSLNDLMVSGAKVVKY